ncbi:MAG TPA: hypothetical protein VEH84_09830 [Alphaproteobacteria bacterium]|nr:hypothetical protein [Alphaproteobacteria bacterium]
MRNPIDAAAPAPAAPVLAIPPFQGMLEHRALGAARGTLIPALCGCGRHMATAPLPCPEAGADR